MPYGHPASGSGRPARANARRRHRSPDAGSDEDDSGNEHDGDKGDGWDNENGVLRDTGIAHRLKMAVTRGYHAAPDRLDAEDTHQVETGEGTTAWRFTCVLESTPGTAGGLLHSG